MPVKTSSADLHRPMASFYRLDFAVIPFAVSPKKLSMFGLWPPMEKIDMSENKAFIVQVLNRVRGGLARASQKMAPPHAAMLEMITGCWLSQAIATAAE